MPDHRVLAGGFRMGSIPTPSVLNRFGTEWLSSNSPRKKRIREERFATREELVQLVTEILDNLGKEFYREGIEKLITRYEKCRDYDGDYVEK